LKKKNTKIDEVKNNVNGLVEQKENVESKDNLLKNDSSPKSLKIKSERIPKINELNTGLGIKLTSTVNVLTTEKNQNSTHPKKSKSKEYDPKQKFLPNNNRNKKNQKSKSLPDYSHLPIPNVESVKKTKYDNKPHYKKKVKPNTINLEEENKTPPTIQPKIEKIEPKKETKRAPEVFLLSRIKESKDESIIPEQEQLETTKFNIPTGKQMKIDVKDHSMKLELEHKTYQNDFSSDEIYFKNNKFLNPDVSDKQFYFSNFLKAKGVIGDGKISETLDKPVWEKLSTFGEDKQESSTHSLFSGSFFSTSPSPSPLFLNSKEVSKPLPPQSSKENRKYSLFDEKEEESLFGNQFFFVNPKNHKNL